jgi:hypothetical protein
MMQIPRAESLSPFTIEILTEIYQKLSFPQRAQIFDLFLPESAQLPKKNPPYHSSIFSEKVTKLFPPCVVYLGIIQTSGWMNPSWVSCPFSPPKRRPPPSSISASFWPITFMSNSSIFLQKACSGIHQYWHTCSYFFSQRSFSFFMQKLDKDGNPQPVTSWTSLLRKNSSEFSFKQFIDQFYHPVVSMLSGRKEPRINEEIQRILHLSDLAKTGDWYLYKDHTEIRVYGCELAPYKLPKYLPIRIFSLEYIRQMINSDDIHFVAFKKKQQLRIKGQIGYFICNNRAAGEEANKLLKEMKFNLKFSLAL